MKRIQHPWDKWEDYKHNFYGGIEEHPDKELARQLCAELLRDANYFGTILQKVITNWVSACEHNLTNRSLNKIAYMGQAACAYELGVPHYISGSGYNLLTDEEKSRADAVAQKYIDIWTAKHLGDVNVAS